MEKAIIIGSGPAGLTAAIYLARNGINPLVIAGSQYGGQLMLTTDVENFPGFENGIKGPELMRKMIKQAEHYGARFEYTNATSVNFLNTSPFKVTTENASYESAGIIVATGAKPRRLGLESEDKFFGRGVSVCATCDGVFFKDKTIAVIGGGDSAMEETNLLAKFASKVYVIHRRDTFRASIIMVDRSLANKNVEVIYNTEVKEILGSTTVTGLKIYNNKERTERELKVDGLFLAIGYIPATAIFEEQLEMDHKNYLVVKEETKSSIPGVFVAGDAADYRYRQAITAAGDGCKAALELQKYLESKK